MQTKRVANTRSDKMKTCLLPIEEGVTLLKKGEVIAYPTESVFGLGCDPDDDAAIKTLLALKKRDPAKGFILVAERFEQLLPYIDETQITAIQKARLFETWPGPVTWLVPKNPHYNAFGTAAWTTLAVRVSAHPIVKALCHQFGKPITSTSANLSGHLPCKTTQDVFAQFQHQIGIVAGDIGNNKKPTEIRDLATNQMVRRG